MIQVNQTKKLETSKDCIKGNSSMIMRYFMSIYEHFLYNKISNSQKNKG